MEWIEWEKYYFSKKELEKFGLIPTADDARKSGQKKAIKNSQTNKLTAIFIVGKWLGESNLEPAEITKAKVQEFLEQNEFGSGDSVLFKEVWKTIPNSDKSAGGRPPKKN